MKAISMQLFTSSIYFRTNQPDTYTIENYIRISKTWVENRANRNEKFLIISQKRVLKQAFRRGKELHEDVITLSHILSNKLYDFVDSFDRKDVISRYKNRNATSLRLSTIGKSKVVGHSELEDKIEGTNGDTSDVRFLDQEIIICN